MALEFGAGSSPRRMASSRPEAIRRPSSVHTLCTAKPRTTMVTSKNMVTPLRMAAGVVLSPFPRGTLCTDGSAGEEKSRRWDRDGVLKEVQIKHRASFNVRLVLGGRGKRKDRGVRATKDGRGASEAMLRRPISLMPKTQGCGDPQTSPCAPPGTSHVKHGAKCDHGGEGHVFTATAGRPLHHAQVQFICPVNSTRSLISFTRSHCHGRSWSREAV
jgi:hypothetical protein